MGYWNYRIIREDFAEAGEETSEYSIHEVYYDDGGNPVSVTVNRVSPSGESMDELRASFELYKQAFDREPLPMSMFEDVKPS